MNVVGRISLGKRGDTSVKVLKVILLLFLGLFLIKMGFGDSNEDFLKYKDEVTFEHLTVSDGLSQNSVYCSLQDTRGFLWFGTQHGLNRFDGYNFKIYSENSYESEGLSNNWVISLCEEEGYAMWIGTRGGGINRLDLKTGEISCIRQKVLMGNNTLAIYQTTLATEKNGELVKGSDKCLWVGTDDGLTQYLIKGTELRILNKYLKGKTGIRVISEDLDNNLWIGCDKGLYRLDFGATNFRKIPTLVDNDDANKIYSLAISSAGKIGNDSNGIFWVGTKNGIYFLDKNKNSFCLDGKIYSKLDGLKGKQINSIFKESDEIYWIGTGSSGLFRYNSKKQKLESFVHNSIIKDTISSNDIRTIINDESKILWIGTDGGGISKYDPKRKKFSIFKASGGDSNAELRDIMALEKSNNGDVWVGLRKGGIFKISKETKIVKKLSLPECTSKGSENIRIQTLRETDDGKKLWIGTSASGLFCYNITKKECKQYENKYIEKDDPILTIKEDSDANLWIGTIDKGIIVINNKKNTALNYVHDSKDSLSLSNNKIFSLLIEKDGVVWVGTGGGGLNKFDPISRSFLHYRSDKKESNEKESDEKTSDSISSDFVTVTFKDSKKQLWVGTNGGGLNLYNEKEGKFRVYNTKDGLPNDVIYSILEDRKGNLWISTNRGISKFSLKKKRFRNFTLRDGLQGLEFNREAAIESYGIFYLGGLKGLNYFKPNTIVDTGPPPKVVFTVLINHRFNPPLLESISYKKNLEFSYQDPMLDIGFAALDYSEPDRNQYKYKLAELGDEGNAKWANLGTKNELSLPNLKPGTFVLKVKGANSAGMWNDKEISMRFRVVPPFWQTTWFIYSIVIIVFTAAVIIVLFWTNGLKKKKRELNIQNIKLGDEIEKRVETENRLRESNLSLGKEVAKREKTEKQLRKSMNLYQSLVNFSPDTIILSDTKDGKILWYSPQTLELFGIKDSSELKESKKNISAIFTTETFTRAEKMINNTISSGEYSYGEFSIEKKSGEVVPVESSFCIINDEKGNPENLFSIVRNITEKKEAEKKEKEYNEQLIQIEKMVSLGNLVSGVAHELNNPSAAILNYSEVILEIWKDVQVFLNDREINNIAMQIANLPCDEAIKTFNKSIEGIDESARRIKRRIDELKNFSGKDNVIKFKPIDVNNVIKSALSLNEKLIQKESVDIFKNFSQVPFVLGNHDRLEQVIVNIIQNACYALKDNPREIHLRTAHDIIKNRIVVEVKDTGIGIEENIKDRIMDLYFTTRRDQGGTGLGLPICLRIVQEHNGTILIDSVPQKGTTVSIVLPVPE